MIVSVDDNVIVIIIVDILYSWSIEIIFVKVMFIPRFIFVYIILG